MKKLPNIGTELKESRLFPLPNIVETRAETKLISEEVFLQKIFEQDSQTELIVDLENQIIKIFCLLVQD